MKCTIFNASSYINQFVNVDLLNERFNKIVPWVKLKKKTYALRLQGEELGEFLKDKSFLKYISKIEIRSFSKIRYHKTESSPIFGDGDENLYINITKEGLKASGLLVIE